jgi:hypothetical protein
MWKPGLVRGSAAYRPLNSPALCVTWIMEDVPSPAWHSSLGRRPVFRKCRTRPSSCLREMSRLLQGLRRCLCTADDGKTPGNGPAGAGLACRESCIGSHSVRVNVLSSPLVPLLAAEWPMRGSRGECTIETSSGPGQLQSRENRVVCLGSDFFRARNGAGKTPRPQDGEDPGVFLSHRDLPGMTGYRVRRLRR